MARLLTMRYQSVAVRGGPRGAHDRQRQATRMRRNVGERDAVERLADGEINQMPVAAHGTAPFVLALARGTVRARRDGDRALERADDVADGNLLGAAGPALARLYAAMRLEQPFPPQ